VKLKSIYTKHFEKKCHYEYFVAYGNTANERKP